MGDDNIYVKFGTDADQDKWVQADWIQTDNIYDTETGDYIVYQNLDGGFYKTILRNLESGTWDFIVRMATVAGDNDRHHGAYIKLNDGNYYVVGAIVTTPGPTGRCGWDQTTTRPVSNYNGLTTTDDNFILSFTPQWVGLRFYLGGNVDVIYGTGTGTRDPPSMSVVAAAVITDVSAAKILEMGFYGDGTGAAALFYRLFIEGDLPTPEGGTATLTRVIGSDVYSSIGGKGGGAVWERYINSAEAQVIQSNMRKTISITETKYGNMILKGEIVDIEYDDELQVATYIIEEGSKKLLKTRTGIVTSLYKAYVHKMWDEEIFNADADWTPNGFANNLVSFTDENFYVNRVFPVTLFHQIGHLNETWDHNNGADNVGGDVDDIYYEYIPSTAYEVHTVHNVNLHNRLRVLMTFKIWYKDDVEWDDATLHLMVRFTSLKDTKVLGLSTTSTSYPRVLLKNYNADTEDLLFQYSGKNRDKSDTQDSESWVDGTIDAADGGTTGGMSPIFTEKFDILNLLGISSAQLHSDYMDTPSAANSAGFRSVHMQVIVEGCAVANTGMDPKIGIHYCAIELSEEKTKTTSQVQEVSIAKIISNTSNVLTVDNSIGGPDTPMSDGVTFGDLFTITVNLEQQLAEFFDAHAVFSLVTNFGSSYVTYAESDNILNMMMSTWLDKLANTHNWFWLYNPTETLDPIEIHDQIEVSGVTLTRLDVVKNYPPKIKFSADDIRDVILVYGAGGMFAISVDGSEYNVEYQPTLGNEWAIYNDETLKTRRNIDAYITSKENRHTNTGAFIEWTLDYDAAPQSYAALKKGVSVVLDNTALRMMPGDTTLFIDTLRYANNPSTENRQLIMLILRRRTV